MSSELVTTAKTPSLKFTYISEFFKSLSWKKRAVIALFLGLAATLSMPPLAIAYFLFAIFPCLLWLLDSAKSSKQAFWTGWLFGFSHFCLGLYWTSFSLFTDISKFWWALPFSATGLPLILAVFPGLACLLTYLSLAKGLPRILIFAASWAFFEWVRGHIFTGFPWNLMAYAWIETLPVLQSVAWVGAYGLSLITVFLASLLALIGWKQTTNKQIYITLPLGLFCLIAIAALGSWRLSNPGSNIPDIQLRLVQPAVAQTLKWDPDTQFQNFQDLLQLSLQSADKPVTHIIWPETAIPWILNEEPEIQKAIARITPFKGAVLTGALRTDIVDGQRLYYNSFFAVDDQGKIIATADKFHLVPFGEFLPFREYLPFNPIATGDTDFQSSAGPVTLNIPGLPSLSPLICYEAIFPGAVTAKDRRPEWLLNMTNDAWFGQSAGPHQHFSISRARAVEEGLPLVRVANTGISAVVDPWGRIKALLPLGSRGVIDTPLPQALPPTLYAQYGNKIFFGMLILFAIPTIFYWLQSIFRLGRGASRDWF